MINITEDTPPDMLTGAMDLTVQLPTLEKTVKMSVERSTPMMDVLVLITTQFNLQVSRYQIEALGMAPSLEYSDKVLPYRPNTPLGALDTQHIRVIRKMKAAPPPRPVNKGVASQPFENTFRLKVHLPQNQLYVTRVGKNIYLNDIMTKVCDEKNLDSRKYEFRHPGNQDQILDAKLTLNDYQITEIYLVSKGTFTDFSNKDIMAFQREEERKRLHTKAGGGVVNLIYKRGRNSLEYTSVPNENQSVSPSQSDDSRSVTPPAVQSPLITINNTINKEPKDQPKAPLRKRKPAPKPPTIQPAPDQPMIIQHQPIQTTFTINPTVTIKPSSSTEAIVDSVPSLPVNNDTVTNICHSRTSSDSSGYHEASILSDNLVNNSSLPRLHQRPKTIIGSHEIELRKGHGRGIHGDHSKSTGNLMTLASKSKSTISLITTGRKKKAAPLPPTPLPSLTQLSAQEHAQSLTIPSATNTLTTIATPVENILMESIPDLDSTLEEKKNDFDQIASHQRISREIEPSEPLELPQPSESSTPTSSQAPKIRPRARRPVPYPRNQLNRSRLSSTSSATDRSHDGSLGRSSVSTYGDDANSEINSLNNDEDVEVNETVNSNIYVQDGSVVSPKSDVTVTIEDMVIEEAFNPILALSESINTDEDVEQPKAKAQDNYMQAIESINIDLFTRKDKKLNNFDILRELAPSSSSSASANRYKTIDTLIESTNLTDEQPKHFKKNDQPEVPNSISRNTKFDTLSRRRGFQIGSTLTSMETTSLSSSSVSATNDIASSSAADSASLLSSNSQHTLPETSEQEEDDDLNDVNVSLFSVQEAGSKKSKLSKRSSRNELYGIHDSLGASQSVSSMDGIPGFKGIKKWNNLNSLDGISLMSSVTNGTGDWVNGDGSESESADKSNTSSDLDNTDQNQVNKNTETLTNEIPKQDIEPALDWKYELPLPPTAFRDNTHDNLDNLTQYDTTTLVSERCRGDSVVSNSELFEKLNKLQGNLSDTATTVSVTSTEYDSKSMYNKLSLEQLQNRKSLVYNREIATTLKSPDSPIRDSFKSELEDAVLQTQIKPARVKPNTSSLQQGGGLPNFKITTYDEPKSKIKIFEDDTSRSYEPAQENNDISYKTRSLMRNQHNGPSANAAANRYTPVVRSGSFSINTWTVVNPLKRSTSQAALIHRQNEEETNEAMNMSTATSTIDVTMNNAGGLQSIGVMKQIQNSLQSPTIDTVDSKHIELDDEIEIRRNSLQNSIENHTKDVEANINSYTLPYPTKKKEVIPLRRWSPPDITLGTWDDRPKTAVFVRQDSNYKFKRANVLSGVSNTKNSYKSGGLFVISNNNVAPQHDSFEEEPFASREQANHITNGDHNVSIKINGSESISSSSETGNVTIRIGSSSSVNNNTEPSVTPQINFRKPFGNINTFVRPHSIAIDTNYEVSRRPVVTSATLKKSITQINNNNNNYSVPLKKPERPNSVYLMNNNNTNQNSNYSVNYNTNRKSWNALLSQGKLISNSNEHLSNKSSDSSYNTNVNVPFSQMRLKRTDSSKMLTQPTANGTEMGFGRVLDSVPNRIVSNDCKVDRRQQNGSAMLYCPPIPPPLKVMPTNTKATRHQTYSAEDKRSSLLSEIQNFGGKKGLRTIRT